MDARDGQQVGVVAKALLNLVPPASNHWSVFGITAIVPSKR